MSSLIPTMEYSSSILRFAKVKAVLSSLELQIDKHNTHSTKRGPILNLINISNISLKNNRGSI